jgi:hypothetical protein
MYEMLMHTLRAFFGSGILKTTLMGSLGITIIVLATNMNPAFRTSLASMRERDGWRSTLVALGTGVFKVILIVLLARLFITALGFQAQGFGRQHGRITETNRSAVLMKWGYPHEQRELSVSHTRKRVWVTRQLQTDSKTKRVFAQSFWKDQDTPVQAVDGLLPTVISLKEEIKDVSVTQKSVVSADVDITVKNNPRKLGNANYAGYEDAWRLKYVIANRSQWQTTAHLSFPLPAKTGLFDEMYLKVDGKDALDLTKSSQNAIIWDITMPPGATTVVEIGYQSRGLEHLRYIPRRMTQTGHYRVSMAVEGINAGELDYPIGSMPPAENIAKIEGTSYTLTWKLDNALTSYDIGIKLPVAKQPEYHFTKLLKEAPVGLILLFVLVTVPRIILKSRVRPELVVIFGVAYCLHYTFMGHLSDVMSGFARPFGTSAAVLTLLITSFRLSDHKCRSLGILDALAFATMIVLYPLAIVDTDGTALWMQLFYLATLTLCCVLLVSRRIPGKKKCITKET